MPAPLVPLAEGPEQHMGAAAHGWGPKPQRPGFSHPVLLGASFLLLLPPALLCPHPCVPCPRSCAHIPSVPVRPRPCWTLCPCSAVSPCASQPPQALTRSAFQQEVKSLLHFRAGVCLGCQTVATRLHLKQLQRFPVGRKNILFPLGISTTLVPLILLKG